MRRVAALVLAVMFSISIVLPLVDSSAHRSGRSSMSRRHRKQRHSRAWWRRYRARLKQRRAAAAALARRRALAAVQQHERKSPAAAPDIERPVQMSAAPASNRSANDSRASDSSASASLLLSERKSTTPVVVSGRTQFNLYAQNGQAVGQASLAPVANAAPNSMSAMNARTQRRQLAGVPFADLRRQVIEKMIAGNGWVVNDMEREINGRRVFVVIAQTAASDDGRTKAETWNFYFTEIEGRIYSLTAHAPSDSIEQMAAESEKVIATLPTSNRSVLADKVNR